MKIIEIKLMPLSAKRVHKDLGNIIDEFIKSPARLVEVVDDEDVFYTTNDMRKSLADYIKYYDIKGIKVMLRIGRCYMEKINE